MPNYATFVVSSAIYVSVKTLEREGSISSFRYYGQLLFAPFHQENEKAGGVQDTQKPMAESFSANLLPALKS